MTCPYTPQTDNPEMVINSLECGHWNWENNYCKVNSRPCEFHGWPPEAVEAVKKRTFGKPPEGECGCSLNCV